MGIIKDILMRVSGKPVKVMLAKDEVIRNAEYKTGRGSEMTPIPVLPEGIQELEVYPVKEPYSYARIVFIEDTAEVQYEAIEPPLSVGEANLIQTIKETLMRVLGFEWESMGGKDKEEYIRGSIESFLETRGIKLNPVSKDKIMYYIVRDFVGYGPVDVLMTDENIEDISCDGVNIPIFLFHKKHESIKSRVKFEEEDELNSYVIGIAQRCGKQISVYMPILDGTTWEGHRVQATYAREVTTRGSTFTIRRYKAKPFTPVDLIGFKTANKEMVAYLWLAVEKGWSIMLCGGTASGKTATLNALALFIPPGAKIITMEDTREINLPHENWIPGTTRTGYGERGADGKAAGEVDMYDLVRAALRQRPNYIIVGEVRGKETYTMFQAMATGHTTYSSMHADSVKSMVNRLENPPISTPRILLTALNLCIIQLHARVGMSQVRRITEIVEIIGFESETNELVTNKVYEWDQATDTHLYKGHTFLFDAIMTTKNMTHDEMDQEFQRRVDIIEYLVQRNVVDFRDISQIVTNYYKEPQKTALRIRKELGIKVEEEPLDA